MRGFAEFLLRRRQNAAALALVFSVVPLLGWVSLVIISLISLRKGAKEGLIVMAWAMLPNLVWAAMGYPSMLLFGVLGGGVYIWLMAITLRETASWSSVLEITAALGIIGILGMHLFVPDMAMYWQHYYMKFATELQELSHQALTPGQETRLAQIGQVLKDSGAVALLTKTSTGLLATMILLPNLINLVLARWWQAYLFNPGGLRKELLSLRLRYTAGLVLPLTIVLAYLGLNWAYDMLPLLLAVFVLAGLCLVHYLAASSSAVWVILFIFYIGLIIFSPYSLPALALLALLDSWIDIRQRVKLN